MKRIAVFAVFLFVFHFRAQASASEPTVTYQATTANSPVGISRLRVTHLSADSYAVDFSVVAPNRTQHTGHIQGLATRNADRLTLNLPNFQPDGNLDSPPLCTLIIEASNAAAKVISEDNCAAYHGAGASFFEQGQNLIRVP